MSTDRVPTLGSKLGLNDSYSVTVYQNPVRKPTAEKTRKTADTKTVEDELNVRRSMHEVIKLGMTGFYKRRRERTSKMLAVELGAQPEKKKYHNYKELQQIRKRQTEMKENHLKMLRESRNMSSLNHYKKKFKKNDKEKKSEPNILNNYGVTKNKKK